ncbi:MAG: hypothetical protein AAFR21_14165 [Pseudomonadota bacterium]
MAAKVTDPTHPQSPANSAKDTPAAPADVRQDVSARLEALSRLLTDMMQSVEDAKDQAQAEINQLKERHAVELVLVAVRQASLDRGPAEGLPSFADQMASLGETEIFDAAWYLTTYPDVLESGLSPKEHYVRSGAFEGRNPGPHFDSMDYYIANPDVAEAGWPALVHYVQHGRKDGRPIA